MFSSTDIFVLIVSITSAASFIYALYDLWIGPVTDVDNHTHDHILSTETLPVVVFYTTGGDDCAEQDHLVQEVARRLSRVRFLRADIKRHPVFKYRLKGTPPEFTVHLRVPSTHEDHVEHGMNSFHDELHIAGPILDEQQLVDKIKDTVRQLNDNWVNWRTQYQQNIARYKASLEQNPDLKP